MEVDGYDEMSSERQRVKMYEYCYERHDGKRYEERVWIDWLSKILNIEIYRLGTCLLKIYDFMKRIRGIIYSGLRF